VGLDFSRVVSYLWAANILVELIVCVLLFIRGYFRRLPFFTAYIVLNLCQAFFLYSIYHYQEVNPRQTYYAAWCSEAVTLVARLCATVEVLRLILMHYRGIWALTWRLLAVICPTVLAFVGLASRPTAFWMVVEADRGYHLIFAVAILLCLALIHYYPIRVEPTYKTLLVGLCWYSCVKILINTLAEGFLYQQYVHYPPIWQALTISSYLAVLILWTSALANPLPAVQKEPAMLADSVYSNFSVEINRRLRTINRQLMNFWKIEGPQP
jgi:hypothetical protein